MVSELVSSSEGANQKYLSAYAIADPLPEHPKPVKVT